MCLQCIEQPDSIIELENADNNMPKCLYLCRLYLVIVLDVCFLLNVLFTLHFHRNYSQ